MGIGDLPDRKKREIEVGRTFIEQYNRLTRNFFALDDAYWDSETDPAPDVRFMQGKEELFAEVVSFDEGGQEGFIRSSGLSRMLDAVEEALGTIKAAGFTMWVVPTEPGRVPHGPELKELASALARYSVKKVEDLKKQHYHWDRHYERSWDFALSKIVELNLSLTDSTRAYCAVSGGVRQINSAEALAEAIQTKELKRYGPGTHLVVDNQGHVISAADLLFMLEGKAVSIDGYDGVWFVSLREGKVLPLHERFQPVDEA